MFAGFSQPSCDSCSVGMYAESNKSRICDSCDAGYYQNKTGQDRCLPCKLGTFEQYKKSGGPCTDCPKGWYSDVEQSTRCYMCRAGFFSEKNGTVSCKFCPDGFLQENDGKTNCYRPFSNSTIITGNNKGKASQVPLAQGWFKSCNKTTHRCIPKPCRAGTRGTKPPSDHCEDCEAGKTSYEGSLDCRLCEKGKYAASNATEKCVLCEELGAGKYSDEEGATECKTCDLGEISVGDRCQEGVADANLPTPGNVSFQANMGSSMNLSVAVRWNCKLHENIRGFRVRILDNPNAEADHWSTEIFVNQSNQSSTHSVAVRIDIALPEQVVYAKVQVVSISNTLGHAGVSKDWNIKKDCPSNQYLATPGNPSEWSCEACPQGGSCVGAVGAEDIVAMFGWWTCPEKVVEIPKAGRRSGEEEPSFSECEHAPACLGASNDAWKDVYDEALIDRNKSTCARGYLAPQRANRLCSACAEGFVLVSGACIECPAGAWTSVVPVLVVCALIVCLITLVTLKVRSKGSRKAPYSTMRRSLIHHIQTAMIMMGLNVDWPQPLTLFYDIVGSVVSTSEGIALIKCGNMDLSNSIRYTDPQSGVSTRGVDEGVFFLILLVVYSLLPVFLLVFSYLYWSHLAPRHWLLRCGLPSLTKRSMLRRGTMVVEREDMPTATKLVKEDLTSKVQRRISTEFIKSTADCAYATAVVTIYLTYPSIVRMSFEALECREVCNKWWMVKDPIYPCLEGAHFFWVVFFVVPVILVYAVILPLCAIVGLWHNRSELYVNQRIRFRFGMLYSGYRPSRWWWEIVVVGRKIAFIVIATFFRRFIRQVHTSLGVMIVFFHLHHQAQPFDRKLKTGRLLHAIELCSLVILLLMNWMATFFTSGACNEDVEDTGTCVLYNFLAYFLIVLNVAYIVSALKLTLSALNKNKNIAKHVGKAMQNVRGKLPRFSDPGKTEATTIEMPNLAETYSQELKARAMLPPRASQYGIHKFKRNSSGLFDIATSSGIDVIDEDENLYFSNPLGQELEKEKRDSNKNIPSDESIPSKPNSRASSRADRRRTILDNIRRRKESDT